MTEKNLHERIALTPPSWHGRGTPVGLSLPLALAIASTAALIAALRSRTRPVRSTPGYPGPRSTARAVCHCRTRQRRHPHAAQELAEGERHMPTKLSAHDKYTIQLAAHGVVALMASSAPGAFTAPRAGIAAAKAMSTSTGLTGEVLAEKPPKLPFKGSVAKTAEQVLPALAESVQILDRAREGEGENFRRTMQMVAQSAARANGSPTPCASEMLRKIENALSKVAA